MRNSWSFQRILRPTLFAPPNSISLTSREMTMTGSGPVSAASVQVPPYWNGTSNIEKKSLVVTRVVTRSGFACWPSTDAMPTALCMMTLRSGMSEAYTAIASR